METHKENFLSTLKKLNLFEVETLSIFIRDLLIDKHERIFHKLRQEEGITAPIVITKGKKGKSRTKADELKPIKDAPAVVTEKSPIRNTQVKVHVTPTRKEPEEEHVDATGDVPLDMFPISQFAEMLVEYLEKCGFKETLQSFKREFKWQNTIDTRRKQQVEAINKLIDSANELKQREISKKNKRTFEEEYEQKRLGARKKQKVENSLVEVKLSSKEVHERMNAFVSKKKGENNTSNQREFIDASKRTEEECARSSTSKLERKTQIKLLRNVAPSGPRSNSNRTSLSLDLTNSGIEERMSNLENHTNVRAYNDAIPSDVYARLKALEDRVLQMEINAKRSAKKQQEKLEQMKQQMVTDSMDTKRTRSKETGKSPAKSVHDNESADETKGEQSVSDNSDEELSTEYFAGNYQIPRGPGRPRRNPGETLTPDTPTKTTPSASNVPVIRASTVFETDKELRQRRIRELKSQLLSMQSKVKQENEGTQQDSDELSTNPPS